MPVLRAWRRCAGCRGPSGPVCSRCAPAFGRPAFLVERPGTLALPVVAAAAYDGAVREALVAFKDHGRWSLRRPLGDVLTRSVARLVMARLAQGDELLRILLVPVPSTASSVRARDGDHVLELAVRVAERAPVEATALSGLVVVRRRRDQVGLGRSERAANLAGSMRATDVLLSRAALPGTAVVLVDDLVTTGATLAEAHRALAAAGVRPWGAAVVAATPDLRRRPPAGRREGAG